MPSLIQILAATVDAATVPATGPALAPGEYRLPLDTTDPDGPAMYVRVRAIRSADLLAHQHAQLLVVEGVDRVIKRLAKPGQEAQAKAQIERITSETFERAAAGIEATLCAGVVALGREEEGAVIWEAVQIVRTSEQQDLTATPPRLWLLALPLSLRSRIAEVVRGYAGGEGAAAALSSFLGPRPAAAVAPGAADGAVAEPGPGSEPDGPHPPADGV